MIAVPGSPPPGGSAAPVAAASPSAGSDRGGQEHTVQAASPIHSLTHRSFTDDRLTPACICGWWSADGSHLAFERHIRSMQGNPASPAVSS